MNELIQQLTTKLSIPQDKAEAGTGALLGMIKNAAPAADFQSLLQAVPDASSWLTKAQSPTGGGDTGGLLGKAAGLVGGLKGAAGMASLLPLLGKAGIDPGTVAKFVPMVISFLQTKVGKDVFDRISNSAPFINEAMSGGASAKLKSAVGGFFGQQK